MRAGLALAAVTSGSDRAGGAVWPERSGALASWSDPCGNSVGRGLCGQGVVPTMSVFVCVWGSLCARCVTVLRVGWFWRGDVGQGDGEARAARKARAGRCRRCGLAGPAGCGGVAVRVGMLARPAHACVPVRVGLSRRLRRAGGVPPVGRGGCGGAGCVAGGRLGSRGRGSIRTLRRASWSVWIWISVCIWWHGGTWGAGREAGWPGRFGSGEVDRSARGDLGAGRWSSQPLTGLWHTWGDRPLRNINRGHVSRPIDPGVS